MVIFCPGGTWLYFAPEGLSRIAGGVSRREIGYANKKALKGRH